MTTDRLPSLEEIVAAGRLADVVEAVGLHERRLPPTRRDRSLPNRLRIVYLVARVGFGEGERLLLAQARKLAVLGADVTVLRRAGIDDPELDYSESANRERRLATRVRVRRVPYGESLTDAVPPCDLIVAGSWEFVVPARMLGFAPVVLFERGELHLLGEIPDDLREVIAASLRAASVTFALGATVRRSLASEFAVEAAEAPLVVDIGAFHPPRRASTKTPGTGTVLVAGCSAHRSGCVTEAADVAAALAKRLPDLDVMVMPEGNDPAPGTVSPLVPAAESERARELRGALLYVASACDEATDLGPLEAMASGTPVVSSDHVGVAAYARHGHNALIAPVGDIAALVEQAVTMLTDHPRRARITAAASATAALNSWGTVAPRLFTRYRETVRSAPTGAPVGGYHVHLGTLRFVRPGDSARLRARLGASTTTAVALPVSQPAFGCYRAVRWRVVAERPDGEDGVSRVYLPTYDARPVEDATEQDSLELLRDGHAEAALAGFVAGYERGGPTEQAVLGRWIVISMIESGRYDDAARMASAFARDFPTHPDYVMLSVQAARAARRPHDIAGPLARVRLLGAGARYDEWFDDIYALVLPPEIEPFRPSDHPVRDSGSVG
jgi:hypothetical protein